MNCANGTPPGLGFFVANGFLKRNRLGLRRGRRRFRPGVTGSKDRRLLTTYTLSTLASFNASQESVSGLVLDSQGNLFGRTNDVDSDGNGTVFEVAHGSNTATPIGPIGSLTDGQVDSSVQGLVMDAQGNLYGTNPNGGYGTVFEIMHGSSIPQTIASFNYADGADPTGGLVVDAQGNLYGTTGNGGPDGNGTVFELAHGSDTPTILAPLNGDGGPFVGGLVLDSQGNLYGTSDGVPQADGQSANGGLVFELAHGSSAVKTLASFDGTDGNGPTGGLLVDSQGNVYGTTSAGGTDNCGTVFEIARGSNKVTTLASFNSTNGVEPTGSLAMDSQGNLYGTTVGGGPVGSGTVFELAHGSNTPTTLASFNGTSGGAAAPWSGVVADGQGNLYGTTGSTVFELKPSSLTIEVNNTTDDSQHITLLDPGVYAQKIPVLVTNNGPTATFQLAVTPAGAGTLSPPTVQLNQGESITVTFTPTAVSKSVDDVSITGSTGGQQVGSDSLTVVNVDVPQDIRNTDTPASMRDRIPPRMTTPISIQVTPNLSGSDQFVTLKVTGQNIDSTGLVILNGGSLNQSAKVTSSGTVNLLGVNQTVPSTTFNGSNYGQLGGNAGKLNLVVGVHGEDAISSNGFSVAAIPVKDVETLAEPSTYVGRLGDGRRVVGIEVLDTFTSDSGDPSDLDQVYVKEQVQSDPDQETGVFQGAKPVNSDFVINVKNPTELLDASQPQADYHTVTVSAFRAKGGKATASQTLTFVDARTGSFDIPMGNSGYIITKEVSFDRTARKGYLLVTKTGASTIANGFASQAGETNPTHRPQRVGCLHQAS